MEEIASSVEGLDGMQTGADRVCWGGCFLIFCMTNFSKHFIMIGVSAMGR